ncbi:dihydroneopterin aldolase [Jannaschia sp. Os4]|uniref:dihydroneopterin aldolase n=1 Tax=Jannaschia sp. Os4 TaxID=2807617 RepID=UPI0019393A72|nr:dihydroneopterin aldolase [Jannaschia sp. Os4]MBM2576719.1 dihydroneopterin aldolase [Jannaschia sp. Os4]
MAADDTDALRLAFAAPLDRARAGAAGLDRISLREHVRAVEIGAFAEERGRTQRLSFDVVAEVAPVDGPPLAETDDVDAILSYDTLIGAIDAELEAERLNLLETLAERVAARVLGHEQAVRVFVRIEKLDRGPHRLGVEIVRSGDGAAAQPIEAPRPHVRVLAPGSADDPGLAGTVAGAARPLVMIAVPDFEVPEVAHPLAQRRVALLAYEQAAWRVAAAVPDCTVVDTRTELDHALRGGRAVLWAPSRIVLDAPDGPAETDPATLAAWFAAEFGGTLEP